MALKIYDTKELVPDAQREAAIATADGKFIVDEPGKTDADVATLTGTLERERTEKREAERLRKAAEKERDDLKRAADAREKGISEEELQKIRDAEALARKPIEDELATTKAENRKLKLTDKVQALYLANGGMPDRVEDAMLALEKRTDLGDAGGIVFLGKDGKATAEDAAAFFKAFKIEKPWLFAGSGGSGSGAGGSGGGGGDEKTVTPESVRDAKRRQVSGAF